MTRWSWAANWVSRLENEPGVARILDLGGEVVQRGALLRVPVRTGELRDSIGRRAGRDARGPYVDVYATAEHALIVELGSRAHVIRPRGPWPLRNRATGQVFGREVHHPGTDAQPYLQPALDDLAGRSWR
jgi:hypothetical protein